MRSYNGTYVTLEEDSVSFKGRSVINNTDLGVFTIATDAATSGIDLDAGTRLSSSVILTDDVSIDDSYYVYYATGEFNKAFLSAYNNTGFDKYQTSFNSNNPSQLLMGHHFPKRTEATRDSHELREARQNYFVRFKLDPNYRKGKGFYFSDLDIDTDGGAFMANYFNYKLVDQNSNHIPVGNNKCGVMLKTNLRQEISSFSGSFATPDLTPGYSETYVYCLEENGQKYVSNMVNFEIKNAMANVTVIAAPTDNTKSSVLGVYKLDDGDFTGNISNYTLRFTQKYDNPDYAFFMPDDNHLSYFDYRVNGITNKGEIGTYTNSGTFTVATNASNATVAKEYGTSEYGYTSGKTRLFAHTFCLPRGRYCLGSASAKDTQCTPKIFYVCAQGQDDGQFDFDDNVFSSVDRVENVDFLNVPRFDMNGNESIIVETIAAYDPNSQSDGNKLGNRRCYIALVNSDRSKFGSAAPSDLSFTYDPSSEKFLITSTLENQTLLDNIIYIAVDNYKPQLTNGSSKSLTVNLLGIESNGEIIVYPAGS